MSKVTTTLVVNFDGGNSGQLNAEIDARPTGYNGGRTSFVAGDQPAFLVFASSDVSIDSLVPSTGAVAFIGTGTVEVSEDLQFTNTAEASLSKPFYTGMTAKWLGNVVGDGVLKVGENNVSVSAAGVGVLRVKYQSLFRAYKITGVVSPLNGEKTFPVLVVISGTKA